MQTQAKREYNRVFRQLLNRDEDDELPQRLELLRLFLESTDFSKLRGEYEKHLQQGNGVKLRLRLINGKPEYEMTVIHGRE